MARTKRTVSRGSKVISKSPAKTVPSKTIIRKKSASTSSPKQTSARGKKRRGAGSETETAPRKRTKEAKENDASQAQAGGRPTRVRPKTYGVLMKRRAVRKANEAVNIIPKAKVIRSFRDRIIEDTAREPRMTEGAKWKLKVTLENELRNFIVNCIVPLHIQTLKKDPKTKQVTAGILKADTVRLATFFAKGNQGFIPKYPMPLRLCAKKDEKKASEYTLGGADTYYAFEPGRHTILDIKEARRLKLKRAEAAGRARALRENKEASKEAAPSKGNKEKTSKPTSASGPSAKAEGGLQSPAKGTKRKKGAS